MNSNIIVRMRLLIKFPVVEVAPQTLVIQKKNVL